MIATELASRLGARASGKGFMINCPCHDDKTPSLQFFDTNFNGKSYIQFCCYVGCTHTDIKKHYQDIGQLPKPKEYHQNTNSSAQYTNNYVPKKTLKKQTKNIVVEANYTLLYNHFLLLLDDRKAIRYMDRRYISKELTQKYQIKNLPENTYGIQEELIKKFGVEYLIKSGLFVKREEGNPYFIFTNHPIIIPYIINHKIETLQARLQVSLYRKIPKGIPKNMNLKGRPIPLYNKKAFHDAKEGNKKICICEGAFDVLSVYMLGYVEEYGHPVGIAGVHNDKDLIDHLQGLQVTIATDNDTAGKNYGDRFIDKYMERYNRTVYRSNFNVEGVKDFNEYLLYIHGEW